jgi:hypothetical protein
MDAGMMVIAVAVFAVLAFTLLGGPMVLADWRRKRREAEVARQVALTDALDERLGAVVAPIVKKTLFGPWEVRIAAPLLLPTAQARMLAVIDEMFADGKDAMRDSYRVVLTVPPDPCRAGSGGARCTPGQRLAHTSAGAA